MARSHQQYYLDLQVNTLQDRLIRALKGSTDSWGNGVRAINRTEAGFKGSFGSVEIG